MRKVLFKNSLPGPVYITESKGDRLENAARRFFSRKGGKKDAPPAITEAEKDDGRKFKKGDIVTCTPEIMIRRSNVDKYVGKVVGFDEERGQYEVEYKDGDRMFVGEDDLRKWKNPWKDSEPGKVDEGSAAEGRPVKVTGTRTPSKSFMDKVRKFRKNPESAVRKSADTEKGRVDEGAGAGYTITINELKIGRVIELKADEKSKGLYVFAAEIEPSDVDVSAEGYYDVYCRSVDLKVDGGVVRGVVDGNTEDEAMGLLEEAFTDTPVDLEVQYGFGWSHVNLPEDGKCVFDSVIVRSYHPFVDILKVEIDSKEMSDAVNWGYEDASNPDREDDEIDEGAVTEGEKTQWFGETKCDICGKECEDTLVDGPTVIGPWAVMCPECAKTYAKGGGQTYKRNKDNEFVKECDQTTPIGEADEGTLGDEILAVYDGGDKWFDRYTIVLKSESKPGFNDCLCLSSNPDSPQGFSQFSDCQDGDHLGKKIGFDELPEKVRVHAILRLTPDDDEGGEEEGEEGPSNEEVKKEYDEFMKGTMPCVETPDGEIYFEYNVEKNTLDYGGATNSGLAPVGSVDYDKSKSMQENLEDLVSTIEEKFGSAE